MKAFTKIKYGGPEVLQLEEVEKPAVREGQILVKVMANSANPADWHILRGEPFFARFSFGLFKPKFRILGADFAGIVEEIGANVTNINVGDKVFGETLNGGAFAEYTAVSAHVCAKMPKGVDFFTMASAPMAGITALQAITTKGKLKKGESILINGSSGGVGHFAVQIAKALGAQVIAVCSSSNRDFVIGLGADEVIAYDETNIHEHLGTYDLVVDTHGNLKFEDYVRMGKRGVIVGFTTIKNMMGVLLRSVFSKFPLTQFTAEANTEDLEHLAILIGSEKVNVQIEKVYSFEQIPKAIAHIEAMRTRGKVAMVWETTAVEDQLA